MQKIKAGTVLRKSATTARDNKPGAPTRHHIFEFDFGDVPVDALMSEAVASIIIKLQGQIRRAMIAGNVDERFPKGVLKINVGNALKGNLNVEVDAQAFLQAMTPEERIEWMVEKGLMPAPATEDEPTEK